nr:hypothetical protein GCM10020093_053170 [Planobispora longispora]
MEVYGTGGGDGGNPGGSFTVATAGDIAGSCDADDGTDCEHERTARLVESIDPALVLTLGDHQYDDGTLSEFRKYYDTTWGRFKDKTRPSRGNHESYDPAGEAVGYKAYFGRLATPNGKTYYSFDHGGWHFVALDSEEPMEAGSEQITWLKNDLSRTTKKCVAAYWHHPLFNSGSKGYNPVSLPAWRALYAAGADLILNGHDHVYERFRPQDPDGKATSAGPLALTVGLGGAGNYSFTHKVHPNSLVRLTKLHGVVKLNLTDTGFSGQLVQDNGRVRDTIPATACH